MMNPNILSAIGAAILFGASTPTAKLLVGDTSPLLLAGLLYLGSGIGLAVTRVIRDRGWQPSGISRKEWPWLLAAIFFGGVLGPVALMFGLTNTSGSTASLLLNLEAVLTALIAWVVFREHADRRVVLGMLAIVAGAVVLSWTESGGGMDDGLGPPAIAFACVCWAIDNNLTRNVSASDALFIAAAKGWIAGAVNSALSMVLGIDAPALPTCGNDHDCWPVGLWREFGSVRNGIAGARHSQNGRVFFDCAVHGRGGRFGCLGRIRHPCLLGGLCADGLGCLATPHGKA
jgi:drug/metabolite transporter (DMT)-like permease